MTRWERLEEWLFDHEKERFTNRELAGDLEVSRFEASAIIQGYLDAQRSQNASTLFVLKREGRTKNAVWSVGQRQPRRAGDRRDALGGRKREGASRLQA